MQRENLKTAVSYLLGKEVTTEEAQRFALEQYGVLCAYIRHGKKEAQQNQNLKNSQFGAKNQIIFKK